MTKSESQDDRKSYELMVILNPDIGEDAIQKRLESIRKQITSSPAEIAHEELWGLKDLAYLIKKHSQGYYAVFDFLGEPEKIKELDKNLRLEPEILRHFILVLPLSYKPQDYNAVEEQVEETKKETKPAPKIKEKSSEKEETEKKSTPKKAASPKTLEEVDTKLQNILENPDLNF
jgi:small subunit ribosomal protein S6